jgi:glycosyltransferase involved in cell wall biosynthesis
MKPEFELGVLFRNNEELVSPFFYCFRRSTKIPCRVIAVNQGSTDRTGDELAKFIKPENGDVILPPGTNTGCAAGRNQILKYRTPDVPLLLMDSDMLVSSTQAAWHMLEEIRAGAGLVYATATSFWNPQKNQEWGISMVMFSAEAVNSVPPFDERFIYFMDDMIYLNNVEVKFRHVVCPKACGIHFWGSTLRHGSERGKADEVEKSEVALHESIYGHDRVPSIPA